MRMTMTGPWGMREAEAFIRRVAAELVGTLEQNALEVVEGRVEWFHQGVVALGTMPAELTNAMDACPSRHLRTAWFGDDAGTSWRRTYAACRKFSDGVTLTNDDCTQNARDMLYIYDDAGTAGWFLHRITGDFEPLAMTLYCDVMAKLND